MTKKGDDYPCVCIGQIDRKKDWRDLYRRKEEVSDYQYTEIALDHFQNPRNAERVEDFDGIGGIGDPNCGDFLEVTIKVDESCDKIVDIGFLVFGCPGAIASTSAMTEMVKGKTFSEALSLEDGDVIRKLGGLPEPKIHCSLLGIQALQAAIADHLILRKLMEIGKVKTKEEYQEMKREGEILFE